MTTKALKPVYLIGERQLIGELGRVCLRAGIRVTCTSTSGDRDLPLPKGIVERRAHPRSVRLAVELTNRDLSRKEANLRMLDRALPRSTLLISSSVTATIARQAGWLKHPGRLVGIGAFPTLLSNRLVEIAAGPATDNAAVRAATAFILEMGKDFAVVQDRVGMVMPRILSMLINESFFAVGEGIASPKDLDTAMQLGTNYPRGPVAWGDAIGLKTVLAVLKALYDDLGEERYRAAPLLRQMADRAAGRKS